MTYVPGFRNDVFISYAHGDDSPALTPDGRGWVAHFTDALSDAIKYRLGCPAKVFFDRRELAGYVDFDKQLHADLDAAILIVVVSPAYSRSAYCGEERDAFLATTHKKHAQQFRGESLANARFVLKVIALTDDEQTDRYVLADLHLSDRPFYEGSGDRSRRLGIDRPAFKENIEELAIEVSGLLKKMRAQCVPAFIWPRDPASTAIADVRRKLALELGDASYRVLPELALDPARELAAAQLAIFLLDEAHDPRAEQLVNQWTERRKPWVIWRSGQAKRTQDREQAKFIARCLKADDPGKTFLEENCSLKDEVLQLLKPGANGATAACSARKKVYLMYSSEDPEEERNAAFVLKALQKRCDVETSVKFSERRKMLTTSSGVLLLWGKAKTDWYTQSLEDMTKSAKKADSLGICLFDPKTGKSADIAQLSSHKKLHVIEQFGKFDPAKLEPFLKPLA